jgi:hypothetical protein
MGCKSHEMAVLPVRQEGVIRVGAWHYTTGQDGVKTVGGAAIAPKKGRLLARAGGKQPAGLQSPAGALVRRLGWQRSSPPIPPRWVWSRLEPLLSPIHRVGRPYDYHRRVVLDATVYMMQTDCGWHNLPSHFPPWQTVYAQLRRWRETGIWDKFWVGLAPPHSSGQLQL